MKVKFLKIWLGTNHPGDITDLEKDLAKGLIARGIVEKYPKPKAKKGGK